MSEMNILRDDFVKTYPDMDMLRIPEEAGRFNAVVASMRTGGQWEARYILYLEKRIRDLRRYVTNLYKKKLGHGYGKDGFYVFAVDEKFNHVHVFISSYDEDGVHATRVSYNLFYKLLMAGRLKAPIEYATIDQEIKDPRATSRLTRSISKSKGMGF